MGTETPRRLPDGFLERGSEVTRLEAFVDATFAFAVTLLVISLESIPDSIPGMLQALKGVPAFAASFAQIMLFWSAHATWSRRFGLRIVEDHKAQGRVQAADPLRASASVDEGGIDLFVFDEE